MAVRTALVAEARRDGERELAKQIGALRKPTRSAWLINLLARTAPDEVGALLDLGDALREAQVNLAGPELRRLSGERQKAVAALGRRPRPTRRRARPPGDRRDSCRRSASTCRRRWPIRCSRRTYARGGWRRSSRSAVSGRWRRSLRRPSGPRLIRTAPERGRHDRSGIGGHDRSAEPTRPSAPTGPSEAEIGAVRIAAQRARARADRGRCGRRRRRPSRRTGRVRGRATPDRTRGGAGRRGRRGGASEVGAGVGGRYGDRCAGGRRGDAGTARLIRTCPRLFSGANRFRSGIAYTAISARRPPDPAGRMILWPSTSPSR